MANANLDIIIKATDQASSSISSIQSELIGLGKSVASIYALKAGFDFLASSVQEAGDKQSNLVGLKTVIENTGVAYGAVKGELESYLETMELTTVFTDNQLIPAFQTLVTSGMNVKQAMEALRAASELAVGNKRVGDITTAVNLLGKAYQGNTDQLKRYGIEASNFSEIMGYVNSHFSGANAAQLETYNGQMKILNTEWSNIKEMIGGGLLPTVTENISSINTILGFSVESIGKVKGGFEGIGINVPGWLKKVSTEVSGFYIPLLGMSNVIENIANSIKGAKMDIATTPTGSSFTGPFMTAEQTKLLNEENKKQIADFKAGETEKQNFMTSTYQTQLTRETALAGYRQTMRDREVEAERVMWSEINDVASSTSTAMTALGVASNNVTLKGMGIVISGVQSAITAVNTMLTASGPVGFILGLLGFVTSAANTVSSLQQLEDLQDENTSLISTGNTGITTVTTAGTNASSSGASVSSVDRASAPTYYTINNSYNLNAGIVLGDKSEIDKAFQELMTRYDQWTQLVRAG